MKYTMTPYGKAISLVLVSLLAIKSGAARATCYAGPPGSINFTIAASAGVVVDASLPPGAGVGDPKAGELKHIDIVCTGGAGNSNPVYFKTNLLTTVSKDGLYEFTVGGQPSGVGMRLYLSHNGGPFEPMPVTRQLTLPNSPDPKNNVPSYGVDDQFKAALERTANPVIYGDIDTGVLVGAAVFYNGVGEGGAQNPYEYIRTGTIKFVRPSCTIDAGSLNQTVDLGSYSKKDLSSPGSTTPWIPFQLVMQNCDAAPGSLVDITFGSAADQDKSSSNLFSLNSGGPTGLGIALATNDGADTRVLPGVVSTFPGISTGGSYKFRARMERTPATLGAGRFDRPITVLVSYR